MPCGAVQHERPPAEREDLGGLDVGGVDRRVGALEDDVEVVVEHAGARGPELDVAARLATQRHDGVNLRDGVAPLGTEVARSHVEETVAAALRLQHQHKSRVGRDVDRPDRIHHEGERERAARHSATPRPCRSGSAGAQASATVESPPEST